MKEFFEEVKAVLSENKKKKINDEDKTVVESFKSELEEENKQELKTLGIILSIIVIIVAIIAIIVFSFRKNIVSGVEKFINNMISVSEKLLDENEDLLPDASNDKTAENKDSNQTNTSNINCTTYYNAMYSGKYKLNKQSVTETLSILDDGTYSIESGNNSSLGNYSIDNKVLALTETVSSDASINAYYYQISDDCQTLTRYLIDGTTIVLKIE